MRRPRVCGLDLSLTGSGVAGADWARTVASSGRRDDSFLARRTRLHRLAGGVVALVGACDLAVVEGPAYSSTTGSVWDRAGLWWLVVDGLMRREIPVAVVAPTARAKYATGRGNAGKAAVVAAVRRTYRVPVADDNQADAYVLAAMGHDWLGEPLVEVPAGQRRALDHVAWPDRLGPAQLALDGGAMPYPDTVEPIRRARRSTASAAAHDIEPGPGQLDALEAIG
jgi:Holliday junction resolvasome RuvABC endonuclease subunit